MSSLVYSDQVPTVPGWYWRRDKHGFQIMYLHEQNKPAHWATLRAHVIAVTDGSDRAKLEALPDSAWLIEWAGPIPEPQEPETEEQRWGREQVERAEQIAQDLYP